MIFFDIMQMSSEEKERILKLNNLGTYVYKLLHNNWNERLHLSLEKKVLPLSSNIFLCFFTLSKMTAATVPAHLQGAAVVL